MTRSTRTRSAKKKISTTKKKTKLLTKRELDEILNGRRGKKKRARRKSGWQSTRRNPGQLVYRAGIAPSGKIAFDLLVIVYPDGDVGFVRAESGLSLASHIEDARAAAECDRGDGPAEPNENLAVYQIPIVLAKPKHRAQKPPKVARAPKGSAVAGADAVLASMDAEAERKVAAQAVAAPKEVPKACAHPGCTEDVDADDYCYGCKVYICGTHSTTSMDLGANHAPQNHWLLDDEFDDDDPDETASEDA